ncbi:YbfJ family protein, partial [Bacillus cereus]|nr:YbfJ family protein [Bacillus cereus]
MCLIILKNGLNKYSNSIWILYCILVIIMMSS